ncbi:MAG: hypothetical protein ABI700_08690 [Chloroflexota bacterium]
MKTLQKWLLNLISAVAEGGSKYAAHETEAYLFGRKINRRERQY